MLAASTSAVTGINRSRLWPPARVQQAEKQSSLSPVTTLCEFPMALLVMILEELDWKDVLRVRKACKALHEVSKTRSVWLNLCRPHFSPTATAPQGLYLERPIKLYTSHDLEFMFLRLKSADLGWRTNDKPARKREVKTTNNAKCMHLVEGGRWLLVASDTGCITYFDLEVLKPTESILIPDQFDPLLSEDDDDNDIGAQINVIMTIDKDSDSSFLEFNLAVSFCLDDTPPPDPKAQGVQLWRVALSLRGPHLALTLLGMGHYDFHLTFIIDWKQANGDQTDYPRRLLHPPYGKDPKAIYLLPDNKLFTVTHDGVMIFDYSDIPETTSLPPVDFTNATVVPLWRVRGLGIAFTLRGKDNIHGLIIDYPYNEGWNEPLGQVVKLMEKVDIYTTVHQCYGFNKATIHSGHIGTYQLNYQWPDEQDNHLLPVSLHSEGSFRDLHFGPFLDEQTGQLVVPADLRSPARHSHHSIEIWDFAPLYKRSSTGSL
ncbi:hypothetical protein M413DRAFT_31464 [Hebeloma cylindrosporum]|uniref:F-box domain-containing protein n=1 Tax=Hebeloma cylindrosporum TaxID=76867 RepID=A0A0C3BX56_HEBCY|nr:hypothetical protein M413DRAFT_31464 [Hebeloma cylindrosporum h7]